MRTAAYTLAQTLQKYWPFVVGISIIVVGLSFGAPSVAEAGPCTGNSSIPPSMHTVAVKAGATASYVITPCKMPAAPVTLTLLVTQTTAANLTVSFSETAVVTQAIFSTMAPITVSVRTRDNEETCVADGQATVVNYTTSADPQFNFPYPATNLTEDHVDIQVAAVSRQCLPMVAVPFPLWRQVGGDGRNVDVVAAANQALYVGTRDAGGLYKGAGCSVGATALVSAQRILDLAVDSQRGLAGTFGARAFSSSNGGSSWTQTSSNNMNPYVYGVAFAGASIAYAGADDGVYSSANGGSSWTRMSSSTGSRPTLVTSLRFDAGRNLLWIGTFGQGLWRLPAGTTAFERNNNLATAEIWDVVWADGNRVFIATSDGVHEGDGVGTWTSLGFAGQQVLSLEVAGSYLYAGRRDGGVWRAELATPTVWQPVTGGAGWQDTYTVRDLLNDTGVCGGLLAATNNGVWVFKR